MLVSASVLQEGIGQMLYLPYSTYTSVVVRIRRGILIILYICPLLPILCQNLILVGERYEHEKTLTFQLNRERFQTMFLEKKKDWQGGTGRCPFRRRRKSL